MTIEHVDCPEADIHNPKGFSTASNDTILTKNSAGTLTWEAKTALTGDLPHGYSYISASSGTTVTAGGTYYKAAGTWTNGEADNITWTTDHFVITVAGSYLVHLTGSFECDTLNDVAYIDINREATIANGNEQGLNPVEADTHAANLRFPLGATFYLEDLEVGDQITPMITATNNGSVVTLFQCGMVIQFLHA